LRADERMAEVTLAFVGDLLPDVRWPKYALLAEVTIDATRHAEATSTCARSSFPRVKAMPGFFAAFGSARTTAPRRDPSSSSRPELPLAMRPRMGFVLRPRALP